jgi:hypothetical protein
LPFRTQPFSRRLAIDAKRAIVLVVGDEAAKGNPATGLIAV